MKSKPRLLSDEALKQGADCLKVMAHPVRLKIVNALMQGKFTVGEIARITGVSPNQTCGHLRLLQARSLLSSARRGRAVYYKIASPRLPRLIECIGKTRGS